MAEAAAEAAAAAAAPVRMYIDDDDDECPVLVEAPVSVAAPSVEETRPKVPVSCATHPRLLLHHETHHDHSVTCSTCVHALSCRACIVRRALLTS